MEDTDFARICLLKLDAQPAGIFIYQEKGEEMHIEVDYLIEQYRDQGVGKRFFQDVKDRFKQKGYSILVTSTENEAHISYIQDLGFKQSRMHESRYELELS